MNTARSSTGVVPPPCGRGSNPGINGSANAAATRTRAEEASTRLNRLADAVLHPGKPENARAARRQADLAEQYVLVLRDVEAAATPAELTEVEQALTELEEAARASR